ncbi:MAG: hypothetical protein KatS3mg023_0586 [Armatimonadota bacterium]|nr:MAG: hypothetical protein KatS3mg023_0586 [Armatimonadota bacterium]
MAAYIRLAMMTPEQWAELFQRSLQEVTQQEKPEPVTEKEEQSAPQEPQQEMKTESVRERIFSPRSASSRTRGQSLREILNL